MSHLSRKGDNASSRGYTTASQRSRSQSRYGNVESKTNTGYHVGKMMEDFDIIQRNFKFKPDEIFPRIKISLLVALMCQSAYLETKDNVTEENDEPIAAAAVTQPVITISHNTSDDGLEKRSEIKCPKRPYLLLDCRDVEEYRKSHLITAEYYPKHLLSRANYETPSLLKYRNHPEYVIVFYDEDEIIAPQVVTTLIQRGYNNVFMLSGGVKVAKHCFPHSLIVFQETLMTVEISQILETQLQQMCFRYSKK